MAARRPGVKPKLSERKYHLSSTNVRPPTRIPRWKSRRTVEIERKAHQSGKKGFLSLERDKNKTDPFTSPWSSSTSFKSSTSHSRMSRLPRWSSQLKDCKGFCGEGSKVLFSSIEQSVAQPTCWTPDTWYECPSRRVRVTYISISV